MIDAQSCDRKFPPKWRSSIAAFSYEPEEEQQPFDDRTISYIRITCSITNFSPSAKEMGIKSQLLRSYWSKPEKVKNLSDFKTFPCYGALLQVVVSPPEQSNVTSADYPYIMDFQPKKREVYQSATDAKEMMSRSLSKLNVRKGATTTDTHEVIDIFSGANLELEYKDYGKIGAGVTGQWGTRDVNQEESSNVKTTDDSREKRESYSYTTQLTQMYHQFLSYHLGTNRAVFLMLPRPNIKTSDLTFLNGPVQLQGMQDVFLVINRPKSMKEFCLEANLETAHLVKESKKKSKKNKMEKLWTYENVANCKNMDRTNLDDDVTMSVVKIASFDAPKGWKIDIKRGGKVGYGVSSPAGFDILSEHKARFKAAKITVTEKQIQVWSEVSWRFWESEGWNHMEDGWFKLSLCVYLVKDETTTKTIESIWLTGRGLCCCPPNIVSLKKNDGYPDWVTGEFSLIPYLEKSDTVPLDLISGKSTVDSAFAANRLVSAIQDTMIRSIGSESRLPVGQIHFRDSDIFARMVADTIEEDDNDNRLLSSFTTIDTRIRDTAIQRLGDISRRNLLNTALDELVESTGLTDAEAKYLRTAIIGLDIQPPQP